MKTFAPKFFQGSFGGRILGLVIGSYVLAAYGGSIFHLIGFLALGFGVDFYLVNYVAPRRMVKLFRQNVSADIVALCAKMCKAKGTVQKDDIAMCDNFFEVSRFHRRLVSDIFNQARTDVAGFDLLANRITHALGGNKDELENILKVLYAIAYADNIIQDRERIFLLRVADIFGFSPTHLAAIEAELGVAESAFAGAGDWQKKTYGTKTQPEDNAYQVLGLEVGVSVDVVKKTYRKLVAKHHPDRLHGNGATEKEIQQAEQRMAEINQAYSKIVKGS